MSLSKVIEIARGELGYTEDPAGSNRVKYWDAYDPKMQGQPWCVAFLWWCFREAGERMSFFGGGKTASCTTLLRWYREQGLAPYVRGSSILRVSDICVGDIVLLNFQGKDSPQHCGLVTFVNDSYGYVLTIEGNTSPGCEGSQDNGGCVALKDRYPSQIVAVCRPQYSPEPVTVDDITGHWAEKDIRFWLSKGLVKGYPDGSFKPDQPVTRAELCVIFERFRKMLMSDMEDLV